MDNKWRHGDPIPHTQCPECKAPITYNGNYYCMRCEWALPHPILLIRDQKAYQEALTQLLALQGKSPSIMDLECTE